MTLEKIISDRISRAAGHIGVYYENLETGERVRAVKGGGELFEAASVIKLWIMSAVFERAEQGSLDMDRKVRVKAEDMVPFPGLADYRCDKAEGHLTEDMFPESGILNFLEPGLELSIRDLVHMMILISDNTATNVLIDLLGKDEINENIRRIGAEHTVLERKLFDTRPEVLGRENMITLEETADYLRGVYRGRLISPEASREVCAILQNQQNTYKIPFYIRKLPIAHKTGEDSGIENDCGIVFGEQPFIMCFLANEADEPEAVRLCQDLALELEKHSRR